MQDAKKELSAEMEKEKIAEESDPDLILSRRLDELSLLLNKISDEVQQFSVLERDRRGATKIVLSGDNLFSNRVSTTNLNKLADLKGVQALSAEEQLAVAISENLMLKNKALNKKKLGNAAHFAAVSGGAAHIQMGGNVMSPKDKRTGSKSAVQLGAEESDLLRVDSCPVTEFSSITKRKSSQARKNTHQKRLSKKLSNNKMIEGV